MKLWRITTCNRLDEDSGAFVRAAAMQSPGVLAAIPSPTVPPCSSVGLGNRNTAGPTNPGEGTA